MAEVALGGAALVPPCMHGTIDLAHKEAISQHRHKEFREWTTTLETRRTTFINLLRQIWIDAKLGHFDVIQMDKGSHWVLNHEFTRLSEVSGDRFVQIRRLVRKIHDKLNELFVYTPGLSINSSGVETKYIHRANDKSRFVRISKQSPEADFTIPFSESGGSSSISGPSIPVQSNGSGILKKLRSRKPKEQPPCPLLSVPARSEQTNVRRICAILTDPEERDYGLLTAISESGKEYCKVTAYKSQGGSPEPLVAYLIRDQTWLRRRVVFAAQAVASFLPFDGSGWMDSKAPNGRSASGNSFQIFLNDIPGLHSTLYVRKAFDQEPVAGAPISTGESFRAQLLGLAMALLEIVHCDYFKHCPFLSSQDQLGTMTFSYRRALRHGAFEDNRKATAVAWATHEHTMLTAQSSELQAAIISCAKGNLTNIPDGPLLLNEAHALRVEFLNEVVAPFQRHIRIDRKVVEGLNIFEQGIASEDWSAA